jgi:hypothetical protein
LSYSIWQQQASPINKASSAQLITGTAVPLPDDAELAEDARFAGLFITNDPNNNGKSSKNDANQDIQAFFSLQPSNASAASLLMPCVEIVNKRFTKILRLSEPMEPGKSVSSYGLDSLWVVEFRNWVRMEYGADLSTLEITKAKSLFVLCERTIAKLFDGCSGPYKLKRGGGAKLLRAGF